MLVSLNALALCGSLPVKSSLECGSSVLRMAPVIVATGGSVTGPSSCCNPRCGGIACSDPARWQPRSAADVQQSKAAHHFRATAASTSGQRRSFRQTLKVWRTRKFLEMWICQPADFGQACRIQCGIRHVPIQATQKQMSDSRAGHGCRGEQRRSGERQDQSPVRLFR